MDLLYFQQAAEGATLNLLCFCTGFRISSFYYFRLLSRLPALSSIFGSIVYNQAKVYKSLYFLKGERNIKRYCALKYRTLQAMNFDTNLIKIGEKLSYTCRQLNL